MSKFMRLSASLTHRMLQAGVFFTGEASDARPASSVLSVSDASGKCASDRPTSEHRMRSKHCSRVRWSMTSARTQARVSTSVCVGC